MTPDNRKTSSTESVHPTLDEVLSFPPGNKKQRGDFYDLQDLIGMHWFRRPGDDTDYDEE